ncbi:GGDEF domain-containing protein [Asaia sp. VD9]|uniref:GGDEF domain-containing protein n=1 Tax=Asaia sp. VD9 TaxID=3081235 RepID=UPI0030190BF3
MTALLTKTVHALMRGLSGRSRTNWPTRNRATLRRWEEDLSNSLLETLRSAISVSDGLRCAFEEFCASTQPERGILISSGPLQVPPPPEPQLKILHTWPIQQEKAQIEMGGNRIDTHISLRAINEVRHQGEIGIFVYFPPQFPKHSAEACKRVIGTLVRTAAAMIEVDHRYRVLLRALPFDPLTHLPVWSLFKDRVERRFARLDHENLPATLMLVSFSGLLQAQHGAGAAEEAVEQIAHVRDAINFLQRAIRPTDLIGQLDRESYILWLDGGDRFASVERAELICKRRYLCSAGSNPLVSVKIGLVTREPQSHDTLETFFERARLALSIAHEENMDWYFAHENA